MGPRRVGKTVLIHHAIQRLLARGVAPRRIAYFSVDHPLYNGLSLEELLAAYRDSIDVDPQTEPTFVFFDEIQYLKGWEVHLKRLVDDYPELKAIASGSAAAALRLKSRESGAGRFTEFLLPPLTFHEYLRLRDREDLVQPAEEPEDRYFCATNIDLLNRSFLDYLNFGGYPEVVGSPQIREDPARFIKADIIDKVLLRDLPSLYGIQDIPELNHLFTTLAFNTADEASLEELSRNSGVAKNTIKRYIEYLEAAFLLKVVHRVDRDGRRFKRANFFKVYLTTPSIRCALFAPVDSQDTTIGALVETAIYSQWFHATGGELHYARWRHGEVDIVRVSPALQAPRITWAVEAKWSDRIVAHPSDLKAALGFCRVNKLERILVTTKTLRREANINGVTISFKPASEYCYTVGRNIIDDRLEADSHPRSSPE